MNEINLKLKSYGCYRKTSKGVFFYTDHGFQVFVPKCLLEKIVGEMCIVSYGDNK